MLNPTIHELVFIRFCICILTYLPCIVPFLPPPFWVLLPVEALYYLLVLRPFERRLSLPANHPTDKIDREALFQRCLAEVPNPERYLSLWALGAHPDDIKRENVKDFLLWAFFDREDVVPEIEDELEGYVRSTEELLGRSLAPGRGRAVPIRLTLDHIPTRYRSVIWYMIVGLVDSATHCRLVWHGFDFWPSPLSTNLMHVFPPRLLASLELLRRQSPSEELCYWYRHPREHTTGTSPTLPIVFLHGIGIGLHPYVAFLASLPLTTPIVALEILPISMRLTKSNILSRFNFVQQLKEILRHHRIHHFVLVGHSYGTVMATHVLHDMELSKRVKGVVLVDPVTLLLHLPEICFNFVRRKPTTANEWQLHYFASTDPSIALVLGRHFFWKENIIFKEELVEGRQAAVCLSSRDLIVDTMEVVRYLTSDDNEACMVLEAAKESSTMTSSGVELLWAELDHSQVFDKSRDYNRLVDTIRRFATK
jgi:pimeloyl-ACP methyl ester carboxylesterase